MLMNQVLMGDPLFMLYGLLVSSVIYIGQLINVHLQTTGV